MLVGNGLRQTFGIYSRPVVADLDISRQTFGLVIAIQALLIGFVQPVAGLIADRYGSVKVIVSEAFLYALDGYIYDIAGSYDLMWVVSAALGLAAAALHWPINDKPLDRFVPQST